MRIRAGRIILALVALLPVACGGETDEVAGMDLATEVGCFACHGSADTEYAPTLEGLWGSQVLLEDGRTVVADEEYVRRAITDPQADVAEGYRNRMPTFGLSDAEVDQLVDYVRSLG